jgi:pentatricopeptide repeat protein
MPFARILLRQAAALPVLPVRNVGSQYLNVLRRDVRQFTTDPGDARSLGSARPARRRTNKDVGTSGGPVRKRSANSEIELNKNDFLRAHERELAALRQYIALYEQQNANGVENLKDIRPAMALYQNLRDKDVFLSETIIVPRLIQSLHNTTRVGSRAFANDIGFKKVLMNTRVNEFVKTSLEMILNDAISGKIILKPYGVLHALLSFSFMKIPWRGLELYQQMTDPVASPDNLRKACEVPKVVGVVINLMSHTKAPIEEMEALFNKCVESGDTNLVNLHEMMIKAYLEYGYTSDALKLFSDMLQNMADPKGIVTRQDYDYHLSHVHDAFVRSKDVDVALNFFYEGFKGETPYSVSTHYSAVRELINNVWEAHHDIVELNDIWETFLLNAKGYRMNAVNSITYGYLSRFFEHYPTMTDESYAALKSVISFFRNQFEYESYFLNTILTHSQKWQSKLILEEVLALRDVLEKEGTPYNEATYRVILNYVQHVDVSVEFIKGIWGRRTNFPLPLERFDFWALARACNEVPERLEFFVEEYEEFRQSEAPLQEKVESVSFIVNPYNGLGNAAASLGIDTRQINISGGSRSVSRAARARKSAFQISQALHGADASLNVSDSLARLKQLVEERDETTANPIENFDQLSVSNESNNGMKTVESPGVEGQIVEGQVKGKASEGNVEETVEVQSEGETVLEKTAGTQNFDEQAGSTEATERINSSQAVDESKENQSPR